MNKWNFQSLEYFSNGRARISFTNVSLVLIWKQYLLPVQFLTISSVLSGFHPLVIWQQNTFLFLHDHKYRGCYCGHVCEGTVGQTKNEKEAQTTNVHAHREPVSTYHPSKSYRLFQTRSVKHTYVEGAPPPIQKMLQKASVWAHVSADMLRCVISVCEREGERQIKERKGEGKEGTGTDRERER